MALLLNYTMRLVILDVAEFICLVNPITLHLVLLLMVLLATVRVSLNNPAIILNYHRRLVILNIARRICLVNSGFLGNNNGG